jgi:hypothetical protein
MQTALIADVPMVSLIDFFLGYEQITLAEESHDL